ncbi:NADH-quinone oxidoreductase subunit 5 family protein [Actinomarinicola tropica]|uniref:NADH-quinone oxidoreductase subunit L n=1 Tax=Actinomarinicola tropica TaxID=2789776 RepID=A0A5Q2RJD6_9ACTN|nr:proton-conducting transporter membrane subunit [Actinomarinicola tropica]QGG94137.1 NADH-quinone oxidoreductase subunit L [Actinomarinicola tropica]
MTVALLVLLPVLGSASVLGLRRRPHGVGAAAVGAAVATLAAAMVAAWAEPRLAWRWSDTLELSVAVDGFARVMVVLIPVVAAPVLAYAAATVEEGRTRLLALMLGFVAAMELLVVASDLLTLLLAWELIGAFSWALIGHGWRERSNGAAAAQAFITTRIGDLGLYVAAGTTFAATGGLGYDDLAAVDGARQDALAAGLLLAVAAKSAQLPFSPWLFSAMAGPTPVSALLHSATLVSAGAYLLIRVAPSLEPVGWFLPAVAGLGMATALAGGVSAALQSQAKRVLAASTSAQYGLMFVAVGAGSTAAAGAQLVTHAAFKSLLFLGAGVAIHAAGSGDLGAMRLGRVLPRTAGLSLVGVAALAAIPPLGGAWSKQEIGAAAAHSSVWLLLGVLVAGALSVVYAFRYQVLAFGRGPDNDIGRRVEAQPTTAERWSLGVLAAITVALSVLWLPGSSEVLERVTGGQLYEAPLWELTVTLAVTGTAAAGVFRAWRAHRLDPSAREGRAAVVADWYGLARLSRVAVVEPTLALSRGLARFDDRVVDAGVRGAEQLTRRLSRVVWGRAEWSLDAFVHGLAGAVGLGARGTRTADERSVDGAVRALAALTLKGADASGVADDRVVDGAVEGSAWLVGVGGHASRKLQTGQAHHYYAIVAVGFVVAAAVLLALTS